MILSPLNHRADPKLVPIELRANFRFNRSAASEIAKRLRPMPKKIVRPKKPLLEKRRLWLTFGSEGTTKPLIWGMSRKFDLVFNIRNSSVTNEVGVIALELEGEGKVIDAAIKWFRRNKVQVDPVEMNTIEG